MSTQTSPARGASLDLRNINKSYGSVQVVKDVSLSVNEGEFVTLLGASGSGKTTLLRIVAGFLNKDSGDVFVGGQETSKQPVHKRRIGMVFQNYALFPHMSVNKNVLFPLARQKFPRADRARLVREALDAVHLGDFGDRMPRELSGGQQQRVALARAIVAKPRLLLMDEPLGALDRRLRESLQVEVRRLSTDLGLTVINVTHDQEEALTMSDRIALLGDGRLVQYGTPRELYDTPNTEFSATFLGESTLVRGIVAEVGGRRLVVGAGNASDGEVFVPPATAGAPEPAIGTRGLVMVRPYAINPLGWDEQVPAGCSWAAGTVSAAIFTGTSTKYLVDAADGAEFTVRAASHLVRNFAVGERIRMVWDASSSIFITE